MVSIFLCLNGIAYEIEQKFRCFLVELVKVKVKNKCKKINK